MAYIDHRLCMTDEAVAIRIVDDQREIRQMVDEGYKIKIQVAWHSPSTFETHCLPIFLNDTLEDVINRYHDFFPKECMEAIADVSAINQTLYSGDGMSKARTLMTSFKIPLGLWKMLESWYPEFFAVEEGVFKHKKLVDQFLALMPKLRTKVPYGRVTTVVS